jgi:hypothetical protein
MERFWRRVDKSGDCWVWTGPTIRDGYGRLSVGLRPQRHHVLAHRLSWQLHFGPIPEGKLVLHRCDNPPCVRPDHLFLGTDLDNKRDCIQKGRARYAKGEANGRAKLTAEQVDVIRTAPRVRGWQPQLARQFGVTRGLIGNVSRGLVWRAMEVTDGTR